MASLEGDSAKINDKFKGENFNIWKFKLEIGLASVDLWGLVDKFVAPSPSNTNQKAKKKYKKCAKNAISIIALNLVDNQLAHTRSCKGLAKVWKTLCIIHETKSLSNNIFVRRKFFTCKMGDYDDLLDHINKIKALTNQLVCLEVLVTNEDVVMTLLKSLHLVQILDHHFWRRCR